MEGPMKKWLLWGCVAILSICLCRCGNRENENLESIVSIDWNGSWKSHQVPRYSISGDVLRTTAGDSRPPVYVGFLEKEESDGKYYGSEIWTTKGSAGVGQRDNLLMLLIRKSTTEHAR